MPQGRPTISTHVLDTGAGRPAAGVRISCLRVDGEVAEPVGRGVTNDDGRMGDLLGGRELVASVYRLRFDFEPGGFFESVVLDFRVDDPGRSYHVPLLLAPYGLTSYRGS